MILLLYQPMIDCTAKLDFSWWLTSAHSCSLEPACAMSLDNHYSDVIMSTMLSRITSISIVCSTICSGRDQRKHQSAASMAFVWGIHRSPVNSPHKGPVTRKMFPFDEVIMTSGQVLWMLYQPIPMVSIFLFRLVTKKVQRLHMTLLCSEAITLVVLMHRMPIMWNRTSWNFTIMGGSHWGTQHGLLQLSLESGYNKDQYKTMLHTVHQWWGRVEKG